MLREHALATGYVSQYLATKHRHCDPEEAFMAGLLHDIGRPVMDHVFKAQYAEVIEMVASGGGASFLSAEQRVFRFDHTDVGFVVVTAWDFPPAFSCSRRPARGSSTSSPATSGTMRLSTLCAVLGSRKQPTIGATYIPDATILTTLARFHGDQRYYWPVLGKSVPLAGRGIRPGCLAPQLHMPNVLPGRALSIGAARETDDTPNTG